MSRLSCFLGTGKKKRSAAKYPRLYGPNNLFCPNCASVNFFKFIRNYKNRCYTDVLWILLNNKSFRFYFFKTRQVYDLFQDCF